jgi:CheY-like chemotaxis protein
MWRWCTAGTKCHASGAGSRGDLQGRDAIAPPGGVHLFAVEVGEPGLVDPHTFRSATRIQRPGRILVVDDEPSLSKALSRLPSDENVVVVGGAAAALARLEGDERYDVVLCDLMMNMQDDGGKAKPYQVRPLIEAVDKKKMLEAARAAKLAAAADEKAKKKHGQGTGKRR